MSRLCMGCMELIGDDETVCPHCGYEVGAMVSETFHMAPGTILKGRYLIGRVIGFGGFGVTYLAYDQVLEKRIAMKEYLPGEFSTRVPNQMKVTIYSGDKEEQFLAGREKFIDEAVRLAKFQNVPEVISVYDCFEENQTAYIVMEYLEGETLQAKLDREGKMSVEQALTIIFPVLHALEAVHEANILHRDIAPDNIYLTSDGKVKLLDFGAARFATTTHSRSLTVLIKPGFAPEEQYRSRGDQGTWTDVYAVAATFYRMITGMIPEDALERAVRDTVKEPSKLGISIGPNTEAALMNALNVTIGDRTQTAKQFEDDLMAQVVIRVVGKKQDFDIGKWPIGIKIAGAAVILGILIFGGAVLTGVIHFSIADIGTISIPEGKTRVPNLVNMEMEAAIERGKKSNLAVQVYDKQYSDSVPEDKVLSQALKSGALVDIDSVAGIIISAGIEKTVVPNVIGMQSEEGIKALKDAGLVVASSEQEYRAAPGTIGWQSLEERTETDTGTEVKVILSKGIKGGDSSKIETVADLVGKDYEAAADEMLNRYLYLVKAGSEYSDVLPAGSIVRQKPTAGRELAQNSNIEVVVSLGRELMTVPDVQYKTREEAEEMLAAVGLSADIRQEASSDVASGNVIRQGTEAGDKVEKGSTIVIYISTGAPVRSQGNTNRRNTNRDTGNSQTEMPRQQEIPQQQEVPRQQEIPQQQEVPPQPAEAPAAEPERNPVFDLLE